MKTPGTLLLENGSMFSGFLFGAPVRSYGEVVFTTSMTGYEHSITDPSYRGQILVFSYPLIGNYDFRYEELQSDSPQVRGIVVSEETGLFSNSTLTSFLASHDIPGLSGVDTRSVVKLVRTHGTMKGTIIPGTVDDSVKEEVLRELALKRNVWEDNLVAEVGTKKHLGPFGSGDRVVALDFGIKRNLIRDLASRFELHVLPHDSALDEINALRPRGIVISSGPGDPSHPDMLRLLPTIRELCSNYPVLGVCLGHQLIALAYGARTYKLIFGHRGINHPVKFGEKTFITSQNHGFAVSSEGLEQLEFTVNQWSLNDGTVEGLTAEHGRVITCQYHPEGGPGPSDTTFIYEYFRRTVRGK